MGLQHPTLRAFIFCLRKVRSGRDTSIEDRKKSYKVNNFKNCDTISVLRGVAHNISYK